MTKRTCGILCSVIGSALGAWWYTRYRTRMNVAPMRNRGTVIFDNTPTASENAII